MKKENLIWRPTVSKERMIAYRPSETEKNIVIAYLKDVKTDEIKEVPVKVISDERLAQIRQITKRLDNGFYNGKDQTP